MRTNLTLDELGDLLDQPIVAVLATYRADGSAMLSPVWFEWRDGGFNVWLSWGVNLSAMGPARGVRHASGRQRV